MKRVFYSLFSFSIVGFLAAQVHMPDIPKPVCKRVLLEKGACGGEKTLTLTPPASGSGVRLITANFGRTKADYSFVINESEAARFIRVGVLRDGKSVIAQILVDFTKMRKEELLEVRTSRRNLADVDGSGMVDQSDLERFFIAYAFGQNLSCPKNGIVRSQADLYNADVNRDGIIDDGDLLAILFNIGEKSEDCNVKVKLRLLPRAR